MADQPSKIQLSRATLARLKPEVTVPRYARDGLEPRILHLGVGGFHRAHQAVYLDDLLSMQDTERWSEIGIGVLPVDVRMRDALRGQDFLYTVVERSAQRQSARVIGSLLGYILAPEEREAALEALSSPATRIVTLTITEGGYYLDEGTGQFVRGHPDIQRDLDHPEQPSSSIGLLVEALSRRRHRGLKPFTVMSCDNLQGNGHVARKVLLAYAALRDAGLRDWIAAEVAFPNSMVDRITPATTPEDVAFVAERFGVADAWPVMTEPFRQWVIEDSFSNGRPEWDRAGAQFVEDVAPFETMKIRLLNGSHLAMAYLGALAGFQYVHDILAEPLFRSFIAAFMEQVTPIVPLIPGTSIADYKSSLLERFSNPRIRDQVTRICSEGSAKLPKWLLPSVLELSDRNAPLDLLVLVLASWIFYFSQGVDENGKLLEIVDARAAELGRLSRTSPLNPRPMLAEKTIFGERLSSDETLERQIETAMLRLAADGVRATMRHYLAGPKMDLPELA